MATHWIGEPPKACNICGKALVTEFTDAREPRTGRWGVFCTGCVKEYNMSYGTGNGQMFQLQADGQWLKTKG